MTNLPSEIRMASIRSLNWSKGICEARCSFTVHGCSLQRYTYPQDVRMAPWIVSTRASNQGGNEVEVCTQIFPAMAVAPAMESRCPSKPQGLLGRGRRFPSIFAVMSIDECTSSWGLRSMRERQGRGWQRGPGVQAFLALLPRSFCLAATENNSTTTMARL